MKRPFKVHFVVKLLLQNVGAHPLGSDIQPVGPLGLQYLLESLVVTQILELEVVLLHLDQLGDIERDSFRVQLV